MIEQILSIMGYSRNTYFNWKKENRPIMELLNKYFSKEDLEEFLKTGKIEKQEIIQNKHEINKKHNEEILEQINDLIKGLK